MKNDGFIDRECDTLREKLLLVPFARIFAALFVGIVIGNRFPSLSLYALLAIIPVLVYSAVRKTKMPYTLILLLGISLIYLDKKPKGIPHNRYINETITIAEAVDTKNYIADIGDERVLLITATPLKRGDVVRGSIMAESLEASSIRNKKRFLEIGIETYVRQQPESEITVTGTAKPRFNALYETRKFFCSVRKELVKRADLLNIYKPDKAVVKAIILGERGGINSDTKAKYASCGVSHVLSISGLHTGVLFIIFNTLFLFIANRRFRSVIVLLLLWFYVFLSGAAPSAMRAALMLTLLQFCYTYAKSRYMMYNILFASAVFFLAIDHTLLWDIGFRLSYLALFAILFIYYRISLVVRTKYTVVNYLLSIVLITVAVQIISTPFVTYYFGVLSLTGILANAVFTTLLPLLMWASIIYIAVPNDICENVIRWVTQCYRETLDTAAALPFSSVTNYYTSLPDMILYAVLFILSAVYLAYFYKIKKTDYL